MSVDNKCGQLGVIGNILCPQCGEPTYKNEAGASICTNRECKWWGYSLTPAPQLEKESVPDAGVTSAAKTLTSSQEYITGLRWAFGYKSNREIYRLRKKLGNIDIAEAVPSEGSFITNTSDEVVIVTYYPAGGVRRFPLVQNTKEVELVNIRLQQIQLSGLFPHMRGFVNPQLSGQAVFAKCYVTDSTGPQANV